MKYTVTETTYSDVFSNGEYLVEPTEHLSIKSKEEAETLFKKLCNDYINNHPKSKVLVHTSSLFRVAFSPFTWSERKDIYEIKINVRDDDYAFKMMMESLDSYPW